MGWCQITERPTPSNRGHRFGRNERTGKPGVGSSQINVTPLIDVLLVLSTIFMVIQPQREGKLPVRAPATTLPGSIASPETLMLTVSSEFQLALNSTALTIDELLPKLAELMEHRPFETRTLFIKAPPLLQYGSLDLLIDLAKGAGVVTVGLSADER